MITARGIARFVPLVLPLYWLGLFAGTHYPHFGQELGDHSDKVLHLLAFTGLSFLLTALLRLRGPLCLARLGLVMLVLAVYGAIDELSQIPVGRHCDILDWCADMTGALLGITIFVLLLGLRQCLFGKRGPTGVQPIDEPAASLR